MEELLKLKELLINGEVERALLLVEDLEEMGKKGVENNIWSFARILLIHLIKQEVERRTTKSWDVSIANSIEQIRRLNARPKGRGNYLNDEELHDTIVDAWNSAVRQVSLETAEGIYEVRQIEQMVNRVLLTDKAFEIVNCAKEDQRTQSYACCCWFYSFKKAG